MAIIRIKLHAAIRTFFAEDPGMTGGAASTVRTYSRTLDVLRVVTSPQLDAYALKVEHIDKCITALRAGASEEENARRVRCGQSPRRGRGDVSINGDISALGAFVKFLHRRDYLAASRNPTLHLKRVTGHSKKPIEKMVVQPSQKVFDALLEAAGKRHPRDRVVMALGLYAGLRESEHKALMVDGVDFEADEIRVWRKKVQAWHRVPMHHILAEELKVWFEYLTRHHGDLNPEWFVVAARTNCPQRLNQQKTGAITPGGALTPETPVDPTRAAWGVANDLKRAFEEAGFPSLYRLGAHTLRRMAAINITNETGNRRFAKTLLGHKDERTTEGYLQHSDDTERLREAMGRLRPGVPPQGGNVVELATRRRVA